MEGQPIVPVTPIGLRMLGAVLLESGYRSAPACISVARRLDVSSGGHWGQQLKMIQSHLSKASRRGREAVRKAPELGWTEAVLNKEGASSGFSHLA